MYQIITALLTMLIGYAIIRGGVPKTEFFNFPLQKNIKKLSSWLLDDKFVLTNLFSWNESIIIRYNECYTHFEIWVIAILICTISMVLFVIIWCIWWHGIQNYGLLQPLNKTFNIVVKFTCKFIFPRSLFHIQINKEHSIQHTSIIQQINLHTLLFYIPF